MPTTTTDTIDPKLRQKLDELARDPRPDAAERAAALLRAANLTVDRQLQLFGEWVLRVMHEPPPHCAYQPDDAQIADLLCATGLGMSNLVGLLRAAREVRLQQQAAEATIHSGWLSAPPTPDGRRRFVMEGMPAEVIEVIEAVSGKWQAIVNGTPVKDRYGCRLTHPYAAGAQMFAMATLIGGEIDLPVTP